jgi:hypothetical protein
MTSPPQTKTNTRTPLDPFLRRPAMPHRATFNVLGLPVAFESNRTLPIRLAAEAYEGLPACDDAITSPAPLIRCLMTQDQVTLPPRPEAPLTFGDSATEVAIVTRGDTALCSPAAGRALITISKAFAAEHARIRHELIEFAAYRLTGAALDAMGMHAACIARDGRALLVMGDSGAGKSTLTTAAFLSGWDVLAEDASFLMPPKSGKIQVRGVPAFIHLMADTLALFPGNTLDRHIRRTVLRHSGRKKIEIDLRQLRNRPLPVSATLSGVVALQPPRGERPKQPKLRFPPPDQAATLLKRLQPYCAAHPRWPEAILMLSSMPFAVLTPGTDIAANLGALSMMQQVVRQSR